MTQKLKITELRQIKNTHQPSLGQVSCDFTVIVIALLIAIAISNQNINQLYQLDILLLASGTAALTIFFFFLLGLYKTVLQHASIETAILITLGSTASAVLFSAVSFSTEASIPLVTTLIYFPIVFFGLFSTKFLLRGTEHFKLNEERKTVAIYGGGAAGTKLTKFLKQDPCFDVKVIVDDNKSLNGKKIYGVPVLNLKNAFDLLTPDHINLILLAMPSISNENQKEILGKLQSTKVEVKTIPSMKRIIENSSALYNIVDIPLDLLLGRNATVPDRSLLQKNIVNKVVLVTGAGGSIGSELALQILNQKPKILLLLDLSEAALYQVLRKVEEVAVNKSIEIRTILGSVTDQQLMAKIFKSSPIDTVYHTAAYKHVPLIEANIMQGMKNNINGTKIVSTLAGEFKIRNFILISTDKAVNPTNYMGASKRISELICLEQETKYPGTKYTTVRFGNVLGSSGSVVPLFREQIQNGGPVTVTHKEMTRYFMTIPEAAQLVIQAAAINSGGQTFVLDMGPPTKIMDLARNMIELAGKAAVLPDKTTKAPGNSIAIKISGLRPGEKLYEELSYTGNFKQSSHPQILIPEEKKPDQSTLKSQLSEFYDALNSENLTLLMKTTKKICPGVNDGHLIDNSLYR